MNQLKFSGFFKSAAFLSAFFLLTLASGGCGTTEDTTAPDTTLISKPSNPSSSSDAAFEFTSDQGDSSFECRMDWGQWTPCSSPAGYSGLPSGAHNFQVRAVGSNNVPDPTPEIYTWTIS